CLAIFVSTITTIHGQYADADSAALNDEICWFDQNSFTTNGTSKAFATGHVLNRVTKNVNTPAVNPDFSYQINICNPLSIQFKGIGSDTLNPYWSFGDLTTTFGVLNPVHTYASEGSYVVKYAAGDGIS